MQLSDDQQSIKQLARDFAERELAPVANALEQNHNLMMPLWHKMADLGLTGIQFSAEYGGMDADTVSYLLVIEELARVSASVAVTLSVHTTVGMLPILMAGTPEQKERYLPKLISGEWLAAFGLTEPNAGSDAASGLTKAILQDDVYILNGSKLFITNAHLAHVVVITARTQQEADSNAKRYSALILEKGMPGFSVESGSEKMGLKGSDWGDLVFSDVRVPVENRLSAPGEGFKIFMDSLNSGRISIGAMALGIAQASLDASLAYAKQRKQFGKPIADFQAIQFKLADMATQIEAARQLVYNAGRLKDAGRPFAKEASMAKLFASETAMRAADQAVQIFGGYGYTTHFPVERYFRDAKSTELVEGTSQIQRLVIARHLL